MLVTLYFHLLFAPACSSLSTTATQQQQQQQA
jgi:hypothetical protein